MTRSFTALFFIYRHDPPNPLKGEPEYPLIRVNSKSPLIYSQNILKVPLFKGDLGGSGAGTPTS